MASKIIAIVLLILMITIIVELMARYFRPEYRKVMLVVLLMIYLSVVLYITLFSRGGRVPTEQINLFPFHDISGFILSVVKENRFKWWMLYDEIMNVLLFIPFGYLVHKLLNKSIDVVLIICLAFEISLILEVSQYIFHCGCFELDDLINNSFGAALGVVIDLVYDKFPDI